MLFYKSNEIKTNSIWRPTDGSKYRVQVLNVINGIVYYIYIDNGDESSKDSWSFQVRFEPDIIPYL